MTRMSREFSLVLLGAGLLTAGYFVWPEQNYEKEADKQAEQRVGGRRTGGGHFIFIGHYTSGGSAAGRAPAMAG
ncbi:MAG: hypothetical protein K2V38_24510, partial [Gemmataceae bacterium]|nr:hypothetical protein [Gemmataceae bacterium]